MKPLDLTVRPPRSCYEELDGLMIMPRTIDKLRAFLPGGDPGQYWINTSITGLSGFLLMRLGVGEDELRAVVAQAETEDEVASWLRARVDVSKYGEINAMLRQAQPRHAEDESFFRALYADTIAAHPELVTIVDILDADDRRAFGNLTDTPNVDARTVEEGGRSARKQH